MACLESAAFALAISGRPVGAAQLHLGGALCRDDRTLEMTKVAENSSSQPMLTVFTYRPTKIQPIVSAKVVAEPGAVRYSAEPCARPVHGSGTVLPVAEQELAYFIALLSALVVNVVAAIAVLVLLLTPRSHRRITRATGRRLVLTPGRLVL